MSMLNRNSYTPDVLDCLANLSNDEVFTPPAVVNQMLDMLPQEVFMSKETTFLDPFTKSGVFLREITKRLLENQIPNYKNTANEIERVTKEAIQNAVRNGKLDLNDSEYEEKARSIGDAALKDHPSSEKFKDFELNLQAALDHILEKQVFGIAITELTAQLARRSLYCSKDASGRYSIVGPAFNTTSDGNIRFVPMKHTWSREMNQNRSFPSGTSCIYCGAVPQNFARPEDLESHAYEFIHKDKKELLEELNNMEFTVICGNPPYHLSDGGQAASAKSIYHLFVEQAKRLQPKYLTMVIPARWYTNGKGQGMNDFRRAMLTDQHVSHLVDFKNSADCFPGVNIAGGICYFLWDRDYAGDCEITNESRKDSGETKDKEIRSLSEFEILVRDNTAVHIIRKIKEKNKVFFSTIVKSYSYFAVRSFERGTEKKSAKKDVMLLSSEGKKYFPFERIIDKENILNKYKVIITYAMSGGNKPSSDGMYQVISSPQILKPNEVCTETYLILNVFDNEEEAKNMLTYVKTKFFRFLLLQALTSIHITKESFLFVPNMDFSKVWTDKELYKKNALSQSEIDFIESMIKPMD